MSTEVKLYSEIGQASIDDEDKYKCSLYTWCLNKVNGRPVNIRAWTGTKFISLASFVMGDVGAEFDHIDRDIYNNQKSNLRKCTHKQNCANRGKSKIALASSIYKGVSRDVDRGLWKSRIGTKFLGRFKTELGAAKAYNRAAKIIYGEFACLNNLQNK